MLKKELLKLLDTISPTSKYYGKSRQIIKTLEGIDEISEEYIPKNSLYHEFL
jgi:hypothetical protein